MKTLETSTCHLKGHNMNIFYAFPFMFWYYQS